mmetsp:Transcript_9000/g.18066  ORF Transcript_9000/g.18066 Transcript_9000/m.18066 type:complete len:276 (-) Transcript_9000:1565-2392(-)
MMMCCDLSVSIPDRSSALSLGISLRTHELYLLVFCCRYLDLFTTFYSLYNSLLKVFFIATSVASIWAIREWTRSTYDATLDTFRHWIVAALPAFLLGWLSAHSHYYYWMEVLWTFSIYLESVAVVPQLIVFQQYQDIDLSLRNYIFSLGAYRALYICNWIYRSYFDHFYRHDWIVYTCGVVQVAFYVDFACFYYLRKTRPEYQMLTYRLLSRFCTDDNIQNGNGEDNAQLTSDAIEPTTLEPGLLETYQLLEESADVNNDDERSMPTNEEGITVV